WGNACPAGNSAEEMPRYCGPKFGRGEANAGNGNARLTMERARRSSSEGPTAAHRATLFPFWIVVRPDDLPPVGLATKASRYAAAFVSSECALAYLHRQRDSKSELRLVCRATFGEVAERLRRFGLSGLCFDPDPLGRGDTITLAQMDRFL